MIIYSRMAWYCITGNKRSSIWQLTTTYCAISDDKVIRLTTFFVFCDRSHNVLWYNDDDHDDDDDNNDNNDNNDDDGNDDNDANDNNNNDNENNNKSLLQASKVHGEIHKGPHI